MGSSLRQLRRQKARQDAKNNAYWKNRDINERKAELIKNGISLSDLDKAIDTARAQGFNAGRDTTFTTVLAAFALAANELFGFGEQRLFRLAAKADDYMMTFIDEQDAIQAVYDKTGLEFQPDNPFNRVQRKEGHKKKKGSLIQIRRALTEGEQDA